jgi:hypothetical protein
MYTLVFPALTSVFGLIGMVVGLVKIHTDAWFFAIIFPLLVVWPLWFASRLKWVSIDENLLYVVGIGKEIQIPFSRVVRVKASRFQNPKTIGLWLKSSSDFGRKIIFVPQQRFLESLRADHPLVDELKELVRI